MLACGRGRVWRGMAVRPTDWGIFWEEPVMVPHESVASEEARVGESAAEPGCADSADGEGGLVWESSREHARHGGGRRGGWGGGRQSGARAGGVGDGAG